MAIELIAKLKPKNKGKFALMDACDIEVDESGTRLDKKLQEIANNAGGGGSADLSEYATEGYVDGEIADELSKFDTNIKKYIDEKMNGIGSGGGGGSVSVTYDSTTENITIK